jgi:hypothetical protein
MLHILLFTCARKILHQRSQEGCAMLRQRRALVEVLYYHPMWHTEDLLPG